MENEKPIALVDLDQTLCLYDECLQNDLDKLRSPNEPINWWENLKPRKRGLAIVEAMKNIGFKIVICTQGPRKNAEAWKGKMLWVQKHLPDTDITITRDKGMIYGSVLMDDYPDYVTRWLAHRPRGLVIMPLHDYNKDFSHPNVIIDESQECNFKINDGLMAILRRKGE